MLRVEAEIAHLFGIGEFGQKFASLHGGCRICRSKAATKWVNTFEVHQIKYWLEPCPRPETILRVAALSQTLREMGEPGSEERVRDGKAGTNCKERGGQKKVLRKMEMGVALQFVFLHLIWSYTPQTAE